MNRTDLIVITDARMAEALADDTAVLTMTELASKYGTKVIMDLSNAQLGSIIGAGVWQSLFANATPVIDHRAPSAAGGPLAGVSFNATAPIVKPDGSIDFVTKDWTVVSGSALDRYILECTEASGVVRTSEMSGAAVTHLKGSTVAPPPAISDATIDASAEYPILAGLMANVHAGSPTTLSCRQVLVLSAAAGIPSDAAAAAPTAAAPTLCRNARKVLVVVEEWLELNSTSAAPIPTISNTKAELFKMVASLRSKFSTSTTLINTTNPPPLGTSGAAPSGLNHAPAAAGVTSLASKYPRYGAMQNLALSSSDFKSFCKDVLTWVVSDPDQRTVVLAHERGYVHRPD